jgi:hypothetical protein
MCCPKSAQFRGIYPVFFPALRKVRVVRPRDIQQKFQLSSRIEREELEVSPSRDTYLDRELIVPTVKDIQGSPGLYDRPGWNSLPRFPPGFFKPGFMPGFFLILTRTFEAGLTDSLPLTEARTHGI